MCDSDPALGSPRRIVLATPDSQVDTQEQSLTSVEHDHTYFLHPRLPSARVESGAEGVESAAEGVGSGADGLLSQELFSEEESKDASVEKCCVDDADMEVVESIGMLGGVANSSHEGSSLVEGMEAGLSDESEVLPVVGKSVLDLGSSVGEEPGMEMGLEPEVPEANAAATCSAEVEQEPDGMELDSVMLEQVKQDFQHYTDVSIGGQQLAPPSSGHTHPTAHGDPLVDQIMELMPVLNTYVGRTQTTSMEQLYLLSQQLLKFLTTVVTKRR